MCGINSKFSVIQSANGTCVEDLLASGPWRVSNIFYYRILHPVDKSYVHQSTVVFLRHNRIEVGTFIHQTTFATVCIISTNLRCSYGNAQNQTRKAKKRTGYDGHASTCTSNGRRPTPLSSCSQVPNHGSQCRRENFYL